MFQAPNHTQAPNSFFDDIAKTLKEGELRVLLVIMRQTFGWRKKWDRISLSQLMSKTGMERKGVHNSLKSLIEKRLIQKHKTGKIGQENCWYTLEVECVEEDQEIPDSEDDFPPDSNKIYQYPKDTPPSILKIPTKETLTKEIRKEIYKEKASRYARKPIAIPIILNPDTEKFEGIQEKDIQEWQEAFPAINVRKELLECRLWAKGKYRKNYRTSILTWFRNKNTSHITPFIQKETTKIPHTENDREINKNRSLAWEKEFSGKGNGIYAIQAEPSKVTFIMPNNEGFSVEYAHEKEEFTKLCHKATKRMSLSMESQ